MRILGIEYGSWSVKGVEVESKFRKLEILDYHEVRLPLEFEDPVEAYRAAIEQMLARLPVVPEKIVASLPPSQTSLRFLKIPIKQKNKVEKMYRFELEDEVPFRLEDCVVEHKISPISDGSSVFVALAPYKHIHSHIDWLKSTGVDPDWLTFEGMGLINLYLNDLYEKKEAQEQGTVLLLDLGHLKTNLAFFHNGVLESFRSISWGGMSMTQYIANQEGLSLEEAEKKKHSELDLQKEGDLTFRAATQSLNHLLAEIQHSIVAYRNQYKRVPDKLLIAGGTSSTKGMEQFLESQFGKPCHPLHFDIKATEVTLNEGREKLRFGEAYGRANVFARSAQLLFNFRKGNAAKKTSLTEIVGFIKKPSFIQGAKYASYLMLVLFIHVMLATPAAKKDAQTQFKSVEKVFAAQFKTVPKKMQKQLLKNPASLKKFLNKRSAELDEKLKAVTKNRTPMLSLLQKVSEAFPTTVKVDVNKTVIDDRKFRIEGVLYEGALTEATKLISAIDSFESVVFSKDGQRFKYVGQVKGR